MNQHTLLKSTFAPNYPVCEGVILVAIPDGAAPLTRAQLADGLGKLGAFNAADRLQVIDRVVGSLTILSPEVFEGLPGREDCKIIHFENGEH